MTDGVTALEFSINSRYLAVAGDKDVAVFHNVVGHHSTIAELEDKKKAATSAAMRERLQTQINEARSVLFYVLSQICAYVWASPAPPGPASPVYTT